MFSWPLRSRCPLPSTMICLARLQSPSGQRRTDGRSLRGDRHRRPAREHGVSCDVSFLRCRPPRRCRTPRLALPPLDARALDRARRHIPEHRRRLGAVQRALVRPADTVRAVETTTASLMMRSLVRDSRLNWRCFSIQTGVSDRSLHGCSPMTGLHRHLNGEASPVRRES